ncbi:MAG: 50S ribosomal protein L30 [Bacteroidota bacterium]
MEYPKVKIKQIRSTIKRPKNQKATIQALGLGRINKTVEKEVTPQILGMIKKVSHLIQVEEIE